MDDLIKRQDVIDIIMGDGLYCDTYADKVYSAERIKELPTADLSEYCDKLWKTAYERGKAEAHPKKGKWIVDGEFIDCSACRKEKWSRVPYESLVRRFRYCPKCGARMEE